MNRPQPWERQPEETPPAWQAFQTYRDMGATRSTAKVGHECGKNKRLMDRWSSRHNWVLRAAAWDEEQDRLHHLEMSVQRRKSAERNIKIANAAMTVAGASLAQLAKQQKQLSPQDITRLIDSGSKLERLALGEATDHVAVVGRVDGTVTQGVQEAARGLTDEERRDRMRALRRELDARLGEDNSLSYAAGPAP